MSYTLHFYKPGTNNIFSYTFVSKMVADEWEKVIVAKGYKVRKNI